MDIKIVEYQRQYAASLAKMWNMSADSWGGMDSIKTEELVAAENANSDSLKTWLALDGNEVVGYCTFSEYREDEGASYIPLLNVRPDYHSKKVGKALVLKAVETACQMTWPRLDLYTWPGNTKAVPLYKKCGFFWENRDDSTHLMNFIPYVLRTEAAEDFFREADWYSDSVREIKVEPDGRKENEYDFFGYHWQRGNRMLRMEFERRGRGLRLMETEDWLVSAAVQDLNLVFGRDYTVSFKLVNKTGKPMTVSVKGIDDKNIAFAMAETVNVDKETIINAQFHVGEISEEQNVWRTHPGVSAELMINGKKALFKVGLVPKFPALVNAVVPEKECAAGSEGEFFLNIENGFKEPASFRFTLPQSDFIQLPSREYAISLEAEQRLAVPVPYSLRSLGYLSGKVKIAAQPQSGGVIEYDRILTAAFAGSGACFGGETDDRWFVVNGRYMLTLLKFNNLLEAATLEKEPYYSNFFRPQLGLPFSVEFSKTKPVRVEHSQDQGTAFIHAFYESKEYPGIAIKRSAGLQANGLVWQTWELKNTGSKPVDRLWFRDMIRLSLANSVVPMHGKIIETRDGYGETVSNFPLSELSENWIFSRAGSTRGMCWSKDLKPSSTHGVLCFDYDLGSLKPGQKAEIKPLFLSIGAYKNWSEFRQFALGGMAGENLIATDSLEVQINGGNPFVYQDYDLTVQEHQNVPFEGAVTAASSQGVYALHTASVSANKASLTLQAPPEDSVDLVNIEADTEGVIFKRQAAVFGIGGSIRKYQEERDGLTIYSVDNGILSFSAAKDFGPALFSLQYKGREWLDSSFPKAGPKSWWNPWLGGSSFEFAGMSKRSLLNEPRTVQFVTVQDNVGNEWHGLEIQVDVVKHEKFKGLKYSHFILTLPGLAGASMFVKLEHGGLAITDVEVLNEVFLAPGGAVSNSWAETVTPQGEAVHYKHGAGIQSPRVRKLLFGTSSCQEKLLTFSTKDTDVYTNKDVMLYGSWDMLNLVPGRKHNTAAEFFLFTGQDIPAGALESLKKISF